MRKSYRVVNGRGYGLACSISSDARARACYVAAAALCGPTTSGQGRAGIGDSLVGSAHDQTESRNRGCEP